MPKKKKSTVLPVRMRRHWPATEQLSERALVQLPGRMPEPGSARTSGAPRLRSGVPARPASPAAELRVEVARGKRSPLGVGQVAPVLARASSLS